MRSHIIAAVIRLSLAFLLVSNVYAGDSGGAFVIVAVQTCRRRVGREVKPTILPCCHALTSSQPANANADR